MILTTSLAHALLVGALAAPLPQVPGATPEMGAASQEVRRAHVHEGEMGERFLELERMFRCDCGCGLDVHTCQQQMQCGTSPVWSARILASLEAGEDMEAIKAGFIDDYGLTVLMAPPAEGFNLLGYILPGIAIVTAAGLVLMFLRGSQGVRPSTVPVSELSEEDEARLAEELKALDESERFEL